VRRVKVSEQTAQGRVDHGVETMGPGWRGASRRVTIGGGEGNEWWEQAVGRRACVPQGFHVYEVLPYDELLRRRGTLEYRSPGKVSIDLGRRN